MIETINSDIRDFKKMVPMEVLDEHFAAKYGRSVYGFDNDLKVNINDETNSNYKYFDNISKLNSSRYFSEEDLILKLGIILEDKECEIFKKYQDKKWYKKSEYLSQYKLPTIKSQLTNDYIQK